MAHLQKFHAKLCLTVVGFLIFRNKVLLVKHKKLGIWLAPGGHVERDELAHQAVEREFWEETGVKVRVVQTFPLLSSVESEYVPAPFFMNLHWISEKNYHHRLKSANQNQRIISKKWSKGCEQHYVLGYLVKPVGKVKFTQNMAETDGIDWFTLDELQELETTEDIKNEVKLAFELSIKSKNYPLFT